MNMTRKLASTLGLAAVFAAALPAAATEVSLASDFASAYVFRGATFNEGAVLQPGMSVTGMKLGDFEIPLTLGVWGNMDLEKVSTDVTDDAGNVVGSETIADSGKFSEVDLTFSIAMPTPIEGLGWSIGYTDYLYPEAGGDPDREVNAVFSVDTLLTPTLSVFYGLDGLIEKLLFLEFGVSHGFELTEEVGLTLGTKVGYAMPDEGDEGLNNADLSAGLSWKAITASVVYVAQLDDDVLPDVEDGGLYDVEVIGKLSLAQKF